MATGNTPQSEIPSVPPTQGNGAASNAETNATVDLIAQLNDWISADLESLVEKHNDWTTPNTNRKHFGR